MTEAELIEYRQANERRRALKAKATAGPWTCDHPRTEGIRPNGPYPSVIKSLAPGCHECPAHSYSNNFADGDFIVAARNDPVEEHVDALLAEVERLKGENVFLEREADLMSQWVDDLQSGMYVNCVYCGHRYGPKETTPVSMADALKAHVEQCPKHPMAELKKEVERLRAPSDPRLNRSVRRRQPHPDYETGIVAAIIPGETGELLVVKTDSGRVVTEAEELWENAP